jgi:hypothetical protein
MESSEQLESPEVVEMDDSFETSGRVDDKHGSDLFLFHQAKG